ncbi:MAG: hypothetical protein CR975_01805 [Gammaproteobacteria bacterium]|nr:MAG: hypothetical protein CR975_01805 [Gammaproteobacteria bacterium]
MLKTLFSIIATLPNRFAQQLGTGVGILLYYFSRREKGVARINIALCFPELSAKQQRHLVKKTLIENSKTLLEMPRIFKCGGDYAIRLIQAVTGMEHYHKAIADGKGVIIIAPHLGNWELVIHYLNQFSPITAMFAPPKQAFLHAIMQTGRQSSGATLVPADSSGVRAQLKHLKQGGVIGILPDQNPKHGHAGVFAPFMGNDAYTMLLINSLAQRTNAAVIMSFAERLADGSGYRLHILPAPDGIDDKDKIVAASSLNQAVEQCLRIAPAQYQWTYKRFKYQPEGKVSPYRILD